MHAYIISSFDPNFVKEEIEKIKKKLVLSPFNFFEINPQNSLSIDDVRNIIKSLILKPYDKGQRLIIIYDMDKATPEATNAFLKALEEPPIGTNFILTVENIDTLLPTIISRCQVISDKKTKQIGKNTAEKIQETLYKILRSSAGDRILLSTGISESREETGIFLSSLINLLEGYLRYPSTQSKLNYQEIAEILKRATAASFYLSKNVNYKATLDIFLLGLPKIQ